MERQPNPYRPGFNQAPATLAGRDDVLAAVREALDVAALDSRTPRPVLLTGGRGVGKTVLLGEAAAIAAESHSWLTVPVEVRPHSSFTPQLVERLAAARDLYRQSARGRRVEVKAAKVRAAVLGFGAEVDLRRQPGADPAPALPLETALSEAMEALAEHAAGLLVSIDELHLADRDELADLAATLQQHVPDNWPVVVMLAGLPSMRDPQRAVTYLERGEWHILGLLDDTSTRVALTAPAEGAGRPMTAAAARLLADASGGYPYAIQVLGHHAWRASRDTASIGVAAARAAATAAQHDLAAGLYAARWQDASPREREYLNALAQLLAHSDQVTGGDVARQLGQPAAAVSYLRDRLIKKGTLFAESRQLRFPTPGLGEWILATTEDPSQPRTRP